MPSVTLSVTDTVGLSLDEVISLLRGYTLKRQLPGKLCRGAFRPSAFLIKLTGEVPALGQVAGAQFMCPSEATGGGRVLLGMNPGRKGHLAGLVWVQDPGQGASVPAAAQGGQVSCHSSPALSIEHCHMLAGQTACGASSVMMSCEGQYGNYPV